MKTIVVQKPEPRRLRRSLARAAPEDHRVGLLQRGGPGPPPEPERPTLGVEALHRARQHHRLAALQDDQ